MNLIEKFNLAFRKNKVVKINIYMPDRRLRTYVREVDGTNGFSVNCEGKTYLILNDLVYFNNGIANLYYLYDNATPYDMNENIVDGNLTSDQITTILNNKVFSNIINESKSNNLNNIIMIFGVVLLVAMLGGFYFLYGQIELLQEVNIENQSIWESIRDSLLNGDFN